MMKRLIIIELDTDDALLKAIATPGVIVPSEGIENPQTLKKKRVTRASMIYDANRDEILKMVNNGEFQKTIAEKYGFSTTYLQQRLKEEIKEENIYKNKN